MKVQVVLEPGEDGWIIAECPSLPGCVSQGQTEDEAVANIKQAIEGWLLAEAAKHRIKDEKAKVVEVVL